MKQIALLALLGVLCLTSAKTEAGVISVGNHVASVGGSFDIPVLITGGENMASATVGFSVGDGGSVLAGTETVAITAVDHVTGTVWGGSPIVISPPAPGLPAASATVATAAAFPVLNVPATGLLMTFTLDLSTASPGEVLSLDPNAGSQTFLADSTGAPLSLSFTPGTLTLVAAVVPEPATLTLFLATTLCLAGYGFRRRQLKTATITNG